MINSTLGTDKKRRKPRSSLFEKCVLVAICFMPFQKAFTISVGFPLKLSEIFLVLAFLLSLLRLSRIRSSVLTPEKQMLYGLVIITGISTLFAISLSTPTGNELGYTRGINVDAALYLGYTVLVVIAWQSIIKISTKRIILAVSVAAHLAAASCILQFALWTSGGESILKSFNFEMVFGSAYGTAMPRNGSFMEGNYLGFFGGVALFIMIRSKKYLGILSAIACILYSQSTNAILALIVAVLIGLILKPKMRWHLQVGTVSLGFIAIIGLVPSARDFLSYQISKLGFSGDSVASRTVGNIDDSMEIRFAKIQTGIDMFLNNPALGVGPGRFGVRFDEYVITSSFPSEYFYKTGRHIVENGYIQILSELGIFAFVIFVVFLFRILRQVYRINIVDFVLGVFVVFSLNTAPAWTSLPIWLALGYLGAVIATNIRLMESRHRVRTLTTKNPSD